MFIGHCMKEKLLSKHAKLLLQLVRLEVKRCRLQKNWSESELGSRVGVSRGVIQRIEAGDPGVAFGTVIEVCALFEIEIFGSPEAILEAIDHTIEITSLVRSKARTTAKASIERRKNNDF